MLPLHPATLEYLQSGEPVLVGLSGGRDSVALLATLASLEGCRFVACHVHHGIRGESADADARFARELADSFHVPFRQMHVDVPALAKERRLSLEEAAREARQDCFRQWCGEGLGGCVALAHHRDDQAETVIMNLCRAGGGLRGMAPVSAWPGGLTVLRPLLSCSRDEINDWLAGRQLSWAEDATNADTSLTRNAVRHEILPRLNRIFKRDVAVPVTRAARLDAETRDALAQAIHAMELTDPQGRLFLPKVIPLPRALKKAVVFHYLNNCRVPELSEDAVLRVMDLLEPGSPSKIMLPGGWIASRKEKRLRLLSPDLTNQS